MPDINELGRKVKAKYPGQYDDLADADVGRKVKLKYPGQYDDFTDAAPKAAESAARTLGDDAADLFSGIWSKINPVEQAKGIAAAVSDPGAAVSGMLSAQGDLATKAKQSFDQGDYVGGIRHAVNYLIPLIGPELDKAGDKAAAGKVAEATGETLGIAANIAAPGAIAKTKAIRVTPGIKNPNAGEAAALGYLESKGVPIPAGTKTGSTYIKGTQKLVDSSALGSRVAEKAQAQATSALRTEADDLLSRANPKPVSPEQAGAGAGAALERKVSRLDKESDAAYSAFRAIEADPKNLVSVSVGTKQVNTGVLDAQGQPIMQTVPITKDIALPVDMRPIKASLAPVYKEMQTWMEPAKRNSSAGFQAIKSIVEGEDFIQASIAEKGLGGLKTLSRSADSAATRNTSQGLAANAVQQLQKSIDSAVARGGGKALGELQRGRRLTSLKYGVDDIAKQLRDEPVQTFGQLTWQKDSGVALLRKVAKEAPAELPKIGRAYLENLFTPAMAEGGFNKAASIHQSWQNMGPQTKRMLFKNPMLVQDLDKFFLGAKKLAENPNPSGSGVLVAIGAEGSLILNNPAAGVAYSLGAGAVSKMLHSPAGVRALTNGMKIPLGEKAAGASLAAQILKMAGDDVEQLTPAYAQ